MVEFISQVMMDLKTRLFYQPALDSLELKKIKALIMFLVWNQRGYLILNLKLLYTAFLHSIKLSEYRIGIKFDKVSLAVEQNNYLAKTVNVYIVFDLDAWTRNPTNNLN